LYPFRAFFIIAFSSYDKSITVFDINRGKTLYFGTGQIDDVALALKFLSDSTKLIIGSKSGKVILYDYLNKRTVKVLLSLSSWPVAIYRDKGDRFILVSDKNGNIYLSDINSDRESKNIYKSDSIVLNIVEKDEKIYFLFENGNIGLLDLHNSLSIFKRNFDEGDFENCSILLEQNELLEYSDLRHKLDEEFDKLGEQLSSFSNSFYRLDY